MNDFEAKIADFAGAGLYSTGLEAVQVNLGLMCNQRCAHCHVSASPRRTERMGRGTMRLVLEAVRKARPGLVDLTGGAPELNPDFVWFVSALRDEGQAVQVRTNLTVLLEPGMEGLPEFFSRQRVRLVGSLPCYLEENVRAQRGAGVYEKSVEAVRGLNALGYGSSPELPLDLVYNPGGPFLPPRQDALEADYRRELAERCGLVFTRLLTIANMPVGRFWSDIRRGMAGREYMRLLRESFNPATLDGLMCRRQVSVGWDGALYDCDFNLALKLPVNHGAPDHVKYFDPSALAGRRVVTGDHCFGCTAGCGSSCKGALA